MQQDLRAIDGKKATETSYDESVKYIKVASIDVKSTVFL